MAGTGTTARPLRWVHEDDPRWDGDRERVFAGVPEGVFRTEARTRGERLASDWWRVERDGRVVGYGWLDDVWGDAEILLAVAAGERHTGAGAFVLERLQEEAVNRGLNYVVNVVRETHPDREAVTAWLERRGFTAAEDGRLRKRVGDRGPAMGQRGEGVPQVSVEQRQARYAAERERAGGRSRPTAEMPDSGPLGPGHEESGGYVDVERHRF